jgi:hypothetical protein
VDLSSRVLICTTVPNVVTFNAHCDHTRRQMQYSQSRHVPPTLSAALSPPDPLT